MDIESVFNEYDEVTYIFQYSSKTEDHLSEQHASS